MHPARRAISRALAPANPAVRSASMAPSTRAARVCADQIERRPEPSTPFSVFAVYCRNDLAMSQASASTLAAGPDDPRMNSLVRQLLVVLFAQRYPEREHYHPFIFRH